MAHLVEFPPSPVVPQFLARGGGGDGSLTRPGERALPPWRTPPGTSRKRGRELGVPRRPRHRMVHARTSSCPIRRGADGPGNRAVPPWCLPPRKPRSRGWEIGVPRRQRRRRGERCHLPAPAVAEREGRRDWSPSGPAAVTAPRPPSRTLWWRGRVRARIGGTHLVEHRRGRAEARG